MVQAEEEANTLLHTLVNDYMEKGLEEIRAAGAAKLGIAQYY